MTEKSKVRKASAYYGGGKYDTRCEMELIDQIARNKGKLGVRKYLKAAQKRCMWGHINPDICIEYAKLVAGA